MAGVNPDPLAVVQKFELIQASKLVRPEGGPCEDVPDLKVTDVKGPEERGTDQDQF